MRKKRRIRIIELKRERKVRESVGGRRVGEMQVSKKKKKQTVTARREQVKRNRDRHIMQQRKKKAVLLPS